MISLSITEILKGCEPGKIQSVGYMQIIPLLSTHVDNNIAPPDQVEYSNRTYGNISFKNKTSKTAIVPFCLGVMTKQAAQNHGIPNVKCLGPKGTSSTNTAACIQQTQGGTIIDDGNHKLTILPWALREVSYITRNQNGYSKLWPAISEFNGELEVKDSTGRILKKGHLEYYMDVFKDQLDEFIGEFEMEPNMVGAIILMNGEPVGIERAPNHEYWKSIWKPLIRESYGSLVLMYTKQFGENPLPPKTRVPIEDYGITNISDLKKRLIEARKKESNIVKKIINSFIKKKFKHSKVEKTGVYDVESVENDQFLGQIVRNDTVVTYCSLVTTSKWIQNPNKHSWSNSSDFTI